MPGKSGARLGGSLEQSRDLVVGQSGDDGSDHHTNRNARLGQSGNSGQATRRGRGAWFEMAGQLGLERGQRHSHPGGPIFGQLSQEVTVAGHQGTLGHNADRVVIGGQHPETAPGQLKLALNRLVGVGDAAEKDRLGLPGRRGQGFVQQVGRVLFDHKLRFKVQAGRESEPLVGRTGVTIDAAVLTAAVGVEADPKADIGAGVVAEDGPRGVA